ncbi:uncharacterized protein K452DRAFT_291670 [Aplosporella prunicola CBS 121167]|uniref:Uncharacterized protein n=1 Tax=Aplosporella prunicola CBS 121167 TaxID=1176127 RepID=A0A6A6B243_9PEZI|nr:uncharacterized protein K452DRAFT_291670 [Aplosporella prunicola CBS 121167]KAF2137443.1 hypothetical protein K452DRAFT_291670 [Aplosporella prunicola CBS 121167]
MARRVAMMRVKGKASGTERSGVVSLMQRLAWRAEQRVAEVRVEKVRVVAPDPGTCPPDSRVEKHGGRPAHHLARRDLPRTPTVASASQILRSLHSNFLAASAPPELKHPLLFSSAPLRRNHRRPRPRLRTRLAHIANPSRRVPRVLSTNTVLPINCSHGGNATSHKTS